MLLSEKAKKVFLSDFRITGTATISICLLLSLLTQGCGQDETAPAQTADTIHTLDVATEPVNLMYGLVPDTFIPEAGRIGRNQLISDLFLTRGFSYPEIDRILSNSQGTFNARKVRSGSNYTFFWSSDTAKRPSFLVYEHDNTLSHIFRLTEEPGVLDYNHETTREVKFVDGVIETSLWGAMVAAGANPMLAVELSEIYAWTIDFFGLQRGDRFRVLYEEAFTAGKSAGITTIYGSIFTHGGREIVAIPFMQDSVVTYFDEDGNSLKKAFLKAPLVYSRISSGFSSGRLHPILKIVRPHHGVDYAAPIGTPVVAIGDGRIISTAYEAGAGRIVRIRHNSVYSTAYLHLASFGKGIVAGAYVKQGDVIGYVGSSGLSTGPHLDFRFYKNGSPVNPLKVESPPVEPVSEENMERYRKVRDGVRAIITNYSVSTTGVCQ
jgi:murein DD-endopeptidase MepM/ murein hydrolase activator NlpD